MHLRGSGCVDCISLADTCDHVNEPPGSVKVVEFVLITE